MRSSRRRPIATLLLVLCGGAASAALLARSPTPAQRLGRDGALLPDAPLVIALPSVSRAGSQLRPLLERLALSLPELDPRQLFLDLRVRLGLDPFDPESMNAAGIDATGPLYVIDDGPLTHPVLMVYLDSDGLKRFRAQVVERVAARDGLSAEISKHNRGVVAHGRAATPTAHPGFAWAVDGLRLALAPRGCKQGLACLATALRPPRTLVKTRRARTTLAGLPDGEAVAVFSGQGLATGPSRYGRDASRWTQAGAAVIDSEAHRARLTVQLLPTPSGRRRATEWPLIGERAAREMRRAGALSVWLGIDDSNISRPLAALPYFPALTRALAANSIDLGAELRSIADGGLGLHLLQLEPQLPGIDRTGSLSNVDTAFFAEHAIWVPLRNHSRGERLVEQLDRILEGRSGQLRLEHLGGLKVHTYAEGGRVVSYALDGGALLVATGPMAMDRFRTAREARPITSRSGARIVLRSDATSLRGLLARITLFGHGENSDLRALWVMRQAASPALRQLGDIKIDLLDSGALLRIEAEVELQDAPPPIPPRKR